MSFQIDGDDHDTHFWFYKGSAQRPEVTADTNEESIEVQTETLNVTFTPDPSGYVKAASTELTAAATITAWNSSVVVPSFTP